MRVQVAVFSPIGVLADATQVAHGNRPDVSGGTPGYDVRRDGVQEVI